MLAFHSKQYACVYSKGIASVPQLSLCQVRPKKKKSFFFSLPQTAFHLSLFLRGKSSSPQAPCRALPVAGYPTALWVLMVGGGDHQLREKAPPVKELSSGARVTGKELSPCQVPGDGCGQVGWGADPTRFPGPSFIPENATSPTALTVWPLTGQTDWTLTLGQFLSWQLTCIISGNVKYPSPL